MKWFLPVVAMLLLSACSLQADKIYTVDEFMADDALLVKIIGECRNNPGELRDTPNCLNAEAADGKLRLERMGKSLGG
ncbi:MULTISPECIES: EexN family lipoprotein [Rhizobium]|uniref:EexN family lipoprotein n=1 Tax=Rhizobium TaxID=379 RepID=UPI0007EB6570|nr:MULTISPECIES: EexN family lipoprotein [Rhizobium]ANK95541.1 hypothetical protein AMK01_PD00662 [Rhizobium sp. N6212]ANL01593.1 hypothetical protein AMK00_PD00660 [Rhizobium sp. N621]ANL07721.1 hypothetical protein AMJ99_PD00667 [Rhizobium esperanzae]ANL13892.1 hypothetical protein AMJ98_PE00668 [Rhizobium sp. N1341]ANL25876.1 hypothetical protein AMJ96_PD00677 [Rhizobium sp. N113]